MKKERLSLKIIQYSKQIAEILVMLESKMFKNFKLNIFYEGFNSYFSSCLSLDFEWF